MKILCEYCNSYIDDSEEKCPNCGAVNIHMARTASNVPKTTEELQQWCMHKNITAAQSNFFLGINKDEVCASGIYQDEATGNFIVYKNIFDGTHTVFYEGKDEAYAVFDCYMRLRESLLKQTPTVIHSHSHSESDLPLYDPYEELRNGEGLDLNIKWKLDKKKLWKASPFILIAILVLLFLGFSINGPAEGYYKYEDNIYYFQKNCGWYEFIRSEPQDDRAYPYDGRWDLASPESILTCFNGLYFVADETGDAQTLPDFSESLYHVPEGCEPNFDENGYYDPGDLWYPGRPLDSYDSLEFIN